MTAAIKIPCYPREDTGYDVVLQAMRKLEISLLDCEIDAYFIGNWWHVELQGSTFWVNSLSGRVLRGEAMSEGEVEVSIAGDYAVMKTGSMYFYYGYEFVWCVGHQKFTDRCGDDCVTEWAFYVKSSGEYRAQYRCSKNYSEFEVQDQLIHGLGRYIANANSKGKL